MPVNQSPTNQPIKPPTGGNNAEPIAAPTAPPPNLAAVFPSSATPCPIPCSLVAVIAFGREPKIVSPANKNGIALPKPLVAPLIPPQIPLFSAAFAALKPSLAEVFMVDGIPTMFLYIRLKKLPSADDFTATSFSIAWKPAFALVQTSPFVSLIALPMISVLKPIAASG